MAQRRESESVGAGERLMQVRFVPVAAIDVGEQKLRLSVDDDGVVELAADIARRGLLQPIGVRAGVDGRYQLLWGLRRLLAHVRLGRQVVQARVDTDPAESVRGVALAENFLRRQLTLEEEVHAVCGLEAEGLSVSQISDLVGCSRAWVLRRLAVPQLPSDLREHVVSGSLALGAAEVLARVEDPAARAYLRSQADVGDWSVAQLRDAVAAYSAAADAGAAAAAAPVSAAPVVVVPVVYCCVACKRPRPAEETILVRVCADGCQGAAAAPVQ